MATLLRANPPTPPDLYECSPDYGRGLRSGDCIHAIAGLPGGSTEVRFTTDREGHPINLPLSATHVTVSGRRETKSAVQSPGNTDPAVPLLISNYMAGLQGIGSSDTSRMRKVSSVGQKMWELRSQGMKRDKSETWWIGIPPSRVNQMVYECDAGLGNPPVVDCLQIEWSQLRSGSAGGSLDTVRVGPKAVQVQAAVATLMNMCIQTPAAGPRGGRAYYRPPERVTRRMKDRRDNPPLTGLNALPPHANITIFQQQEPWTNLAVELQSCTLNAALQGNPVSKCNKK
ncbi:MAG: hypothetical protein Q9187_004238 [Circinaria calcarea]